MSSWLHVLQAEYVFLADIETNCFVAVHKPVCNVEPVHLGSDRMSLMYQM